MSSVFILGVQGLDPDTAASRSSPALLFTSYVVAPLLVFFSPPGTPVSAHKLKKKKQNEVAVMTVCTGTVRGRVISGKLMKEARVVPATFYISTGVVVQWVCLVKMFELDIYGLFIFMYVLSFTENVVKSIN